MAFFTKKKNNYFAGSRYCCCNFKSSCGACLYEFDVGRHTVWR